MNLRRLLRATLAVDAPVCPPRVPNPRTTGGASRGPTHLLEGSARPLRAVGPMVERWLQVQDFVSALSRFAPRSSTALAEKEKPSPQPR